MVDSNRNTASVVLYGHRVILVDGDFDVVAGSRQGFVNRIVYDFVDQVMEPSRSRRADVHAGTLPHRFQTFQNLDLVGAVFFVIFYVHSVPPNLFMNLVYDASALHVEGLVYLKMIPGQFVHSGAGNERLRIPDSRKKEFLPFRIQL